MITKNNIIIFILIVVLFINGFSFWKFFLPAKILNKNEIENFSKNIQLINEAKKNISGKVFCTTITGGMDIVTGGESVNNALPVKNIYSFSIVNGSGVPDAAKKFGDKLKGNAWIEIVSFENSQTTGKTVLKLKGDLPSENKKILIEILKQDYPNFIEEIDNKITEDVIIVLGSE